MGSDRVLAAATGVYGATADRSENSAGRHFVDPQHWFLLAGLARRLWSLADGLSPFQSLDFRRHAQTNAADAATGDARGGTDRSRLVVHRRDDCPCPSVRCRRWKKGEPQEPTDHGLGRSRGGFSSKIHLVCDGQGHPLHCEVTAGQRHETTAFEDLLSNVPALDGEQEELVFPLAVAGDKGYDAAWIRDWLDDFKIEPVIPHRSVGEQASNDFFDKQTYRRRNVVERLVGWIKTCRRVFSRFEKTATNFLGMIQLAFIQRYLKFIT